MALFGKHFLALDWDFDKERLYGFETFKDLTESVDIVTALPDNSQVMFYRISDGQLYLLERRKKKGISDKVFETTTQGKLQESRHASLKKLMARVTKTNDPDDDLEFGDRNALEKHFLKLVRSRFDFVQGALDRVQSLMSLD